MNIEKVNEIINNNGLFTSEFVQTMFDYIDLYNSKMKVEQEKIGKLENGILLVEDNMSQDNKEYIEQVKFINNINRITSSLISERNNLEKELSEINSKEKRLNGELPREDYSRRNEIKKRLAEINTALNNAHINRENARKKLEDMNINGLNQGNRNSIDNINSQIELSKRQIDNLIKSINSFKEGLEKIYEYSSNEIVKMDDSIENISFEMDELTQKLVSLKHEKFVNVEEYNLARKDIIEKLSHLQQEQDNAISYRNKNIANLEKVIKLISQKSDDLGVYLSPSIAYTNDVKTEAVNIEALQSEDVQENEDIEKKDVSSDLDFTPLKITDIANLYNSHEINDAKEEKNGDFYSVQELFPAKEIPNFKQEKEEKVVKKLSIQDFENLYSEPQQYSYNSEKDESNKKEKKESKAIEFDMNHIIGKPIHPEEYERFLEIILPKYFQSELDKKNDKELGEKFKITMLLAYINCEYDELENMTYAELENSVVNEAEKRKKIENYFLQEKNEKVLLSPLYISSKEASKILISKLYFSNEVKSDLSNFNQVVSNLLGISIEEVNNYFNIRGGDTQLLEMIDEKTGKKLFEEKNNDEEKTINFNKTKNEESFEEHDEELEDETQYKNLKSKKILQSLSKELGIEYNQLLTYSLDKVYELIFPFISNKDELRRKGFSPEEVEQILGMSIEEFEKYRKDKAKDNDPRLVENDKPILSREEINNMTGREFIFDYLLSTKNDNLAEKYYYEYIDYLKSKDIAFAHAEIIGDLQADVEEIEKEKIRNSKSRKIVNIIKAPVDIYIKDIKAGNSVIFNTFRKIKDDVKNLGRTMIGEESDTLRGIDALTKFVKLYEKGLLTYKNQLLLAKVVGLKNLDGVTVEEIKERLRDLASKLGVDEFNLLQEPLNNALDTIYEVSKNYGISENEFANLSFEELEDLIDETEEKSEVSKILEEMRQNQESESRKGR